MKKFIAENLNESMGYKTIFGDEISHNEALQERLRRLITNIITEEKGISEKAFGDYDSVMIEVQDICDKNPEIYEKAENFYTDKKRLNLLAEEIYEEFFKTEDI